MAGTLVVCASKRRTSRRSGGGHSTRRARLAPHRSASGARHVVWRPMCRTGCSGLCREVLWHAGPACTTARGQGVDSARLAIGVGGVSALRHGAVCGGQRASLSAPGAWQAGTARRPHRHPVRQGQGWTRFGISVDSAVTSPLSSALSPHMIQELLLHPLSQRDQRTGGVSACILLRHRVTLRT